jgi:hypothetical protein
MESSLRGIIMKTRICALLFAFLFSALAMAAPNASPSFKVSYLDGSAFSGAAAGSSASWKALKLGDVVSPEAFLKLEAGASVELSRTDSRLYLSQKGVYRIGDLLAAKAKIGPKGVGGVLSAKMSKLVADSTPSRGTVAGVRGAEAGKDSGDVEWAGSGAWEAVLRAKDSIERGKYQDAIGALVAARDQASADELSELQYYLAYAYSLSDDPRMAAASLALVEARPDATWSGDYILLQAKLYVDSFAYAQAIAWLTQGGHDLSGDPVLGGLYCFLLGEAYRGSGDSARERQSFQKVVSMGADAELGKAAAELLENP